MEIIIQVDEKSGLLELEAWRKWTSVTMTDISVADEPDEFPEFFDREKKKIRTLEAQYNMISNCFMTVSDFHEALWTTCCSMKNKTIGQRTVVDTQFQRLASALWNKKRRHQTIASSFTVSC